jgi:hypothetical protein
MTAAEARSAAEAAWVVMRVTAEARDAAVSWPAHAAADDANVTAWHAWLAAEAAVIAAEARP